MAKIDYALPIYGHTSKHNLSRINSVYHAGIRHALGSFWSTPIKNLLTESGLMSIADRRDILTRTIITKLYSSLKSNITDIAPKRSCLKTLPRKQSALIRSINFAKEHKIILQNKAYSKQIKPPWMLRENSLDFTLAKWKKRGHEYKLIFG